MGYKPSLLFFLCFFMGILQFSAQTSSTASFIASATIIQPIGITSTADMNFANIDAQQGGSVILTPENMRHSTEDVVLGEGEDQSPASFIVTGEPGLAYSINIPSQSYTLSNGVEEMILENFTSSLGNGGILAEGKQEFNLGATLNINPGQTPGFYTSPAPMDITVIYN